MNISKRFKIIRKKQNIFYIKIGRMHKRGSKKTRKNLTNFIEYGMIITVS